MTIQEAIEKYRQSSEADPDSVSCYGITPRLAGEMPLSVAQQELVDRLRDGIALQLPSVSEEVFYRGSSFKYFENNLVGEPFVYMPFISATKELGEALRFLKEEEPVILTVIAPSGSKFKQISDASVATLENYEVLFQDALTVEISETNPSEFNEIQQIQMQNAPTKDTPRFFTLILTPKDTVIR